MQEKEAKLEAEQSQKSETPHRTYEKPKLQSHDSWKVVTGFIASI